MTGMIIGYGTSHDAGIAVVDDKTGAPLFAASLERLSRRKIHGGSPLPLLPWVRRHLGPAFDPSLPLLLTDDQIFRPEHGFYHAETGGGGLLYRWTSAEAVLEVPPGVVCTGILLGLISERNCARHLEADILFDGQPVATVSNRRHTWKIPVRPAGTAIRTITIRARAPFQLPPDPRTLGILVSSVTLLSPEEGGLSRHSHAVSEIGWVASIAKLLRKQFFDLPRLGLRGHSPGNLKYNLLRQVQARRDGYRSTPEMVMDAGTHFTVSSRFDHHVCHAASAYYQSGFERALVVTLDGMGDWLSCRVMIGTDGRLVPVEQFYYEQMPIGLCYEYVTAMLGFHPLRHGGKVTGLAAFGKDNPECEAALEDFFRRSWSRRGPASLSFENLLGPGEEGYARLRELRRTEFGRFSREDLAHAVQKRTEREVCALISRYRERYPDLQDVALAGGVFANVRVNQKVRELGFRRIFIQPAMSDAGLCMGAALLECARLNGGRLAPLRLEHVYLGPDFSNEEIASELKRQGLQGEWIDEEAIAGVIARHIAERKVVAHFNGRMEYGPRALGNRSILYGASDPDVNRWLNEQLQRTEFMPFAPAVLAEAAGDYFLNVEGAEHAAEFMTITFDCTEKARREIPAAVHVDGTARPQFVRRETNPRFHAILTAYRELTGVPCVINTSFNMHEEPIVATPDDAIRSFRRGNLDVLVLGSYLVTKA